jgi:hypothetical protein
VDGRLEVVAAAFTGLAATEVDACVDSWALRLWAVATLVTIANARAIVTIGCCRGVVFMVGMGRILIVMTGIPLESQKNTLRVKREKHSVR